MEEFLPGTISVSDFERRRDAATAHCLRELEQQLKDRKKRQTLRNVKLPLAVCGIVAFLVILAFLCPVYLKVCNMLHNCKAARLLAQCTTFHHFPVGKDPSAPFGWPCFTISSAGSCTGGRCIYTNFPC